ncbi:hypothetical protein OG895_37960 [Streptomyces sp. NBC_00201]|uniref:hypothetical protein n=1 Tax=unclassified Streptomyces TaxID=2593676 RepID=UPI00224FFF45|nr:MULTISPECIES: hypothetical protein [unclassified Streptomyces]MCX5250918.1 hypothetical protein [Streptomyces sp. NBC_00201]MCX5291153.1 hypothetical protein [Streptomyces sp. NBC_00183]
MRRLTAVAALAAAAPAPAGCSGSSDEKPARTVTVTVKTPKLSAAEQQKACVDAWTKPLHDNADAGVDDAPAECAKVPRSHS